MKHIGYTTADKEPTTWGKYFPAGPIKLYIPDPGTRENIDADRWQHVGWICPPTGGVIYPTHANAADHGDARPAYIERAEPVPVFRDVTTEDLIAFKPGRLDPMDVRRSEFEALQKDVAALAKVIVDLTRQPPPAPAVPADSTFTISTADLLSEVSAFCNEELEQFTGPDFDSDAEVGCQRANVYLRELVRRLQSPSAEPPMTFYDHAFIALAVACIAEGNGLSSAIADAHKLASTLTRNRANPL